jgi:MFS family permease
MELFKIRAFAAGNFASLLSAIGRGGVMLMLIILLQGIYLPLHGYAYSVTPLWAGIFMVPMTMGFLVMGPISGIISDKYGARTLATAGMVIVGSMFIVLAIMPFNFSYPEFALALFFMGIGNGMFASPNTAAIMNSVPSDARGSASGMRSTLMNAGMTASLGMFFTIVLLNLHADLPGSLSSAVSKLSLPSSLSSSLDTIFHSTPPTVALFSAFLGLNPMTSLITSSSLISGLKSAGVYTVITGHSWFPNALAPAFINSLHVAFYVGIAISFIAALVSALRGKKYAHADADYVGKETDKSSDGINISDDSINKGYPEKAKSIVRNTNEVKK